MEFRVIVPYRELANVLKLNSNKFESVISHVKTKFKLNDEELKTLSGKIRSFHKNFSKKLVKNNQSFLSVMRDPWMHGKIEEIFFKKQSLKREVGRPVKCFDECTDRTKRRKIQEISEQIPKDQLERAAIRNVGKPAAAAVVRKLMHSSADEIKKFKIKASRKELIPLTETEAVSLLIELDLGSHQYQSIRNLSKSRNADISHLTTELWRPKNFAIRMLLRSKLMKLAQPSNSRHYWTTHHNDYCSHSIMERSQSFPNNSHFYRNMALMVLPVRVNINNRSRVQTAQTLKCL